MKPGDLCASWSAKLKAAGAGETARDIAKVLLEAGSSAAEPIRAVELLLVTATPGQLEQLKTAIRDDARELRRAHGGASAGQIRRSVLARRKQALEQECQGLMQGTSVDAEARRRIEALASDETGLREAIDQRTGDRARLTNLQQQLRRG